MESGVCIIGNGAWGKALYHVIRQNTKHVRIAKRGERVTEAIIVIAVPANNIRELVAVIKNKTPIIINTAKGIETTTHLLPHEIIRSLFPNCRYFTLIGPGFAQEVKRVMPTLSNLGCGNELKNASEVCSYLETDFFRVKPVAAIKVLELAAALKNIYAIGCGLADGMGYGVNTRTMVTVLAMEEMQQLFHKLKLSIGRESTAGTIGDLILTCNSNESRNFQFGRNLTSYSVASSIERVNGVVEGYMTLESFSSLEKISEMKLPLAAFIQEVVSLDSPKTVKKRFETFIKLI